MPDDEPSPLQRFPRSSRYHPEWIMAGISGAAHPLWLSEWLAERLELRPGMRVLDLGCGRALSSIFFCREFDVQVWAVDLWFSAAENLQRVRDAGLEGRVTPVHADARSLPFDAEFFDAIVSIDSFVYYGTDDLYLSYLGRFLKTNGQLGIAGAGLVQEIEGAIPVHLQAWWEPSLCCLHSAEWWRRHWERSGLVKVEHAETMPDGWKLWLDWNRHIAPTNNVEHKALEADSGRYLGYIRAIARRNDVGLPEPIASMPTDYVKTSLFAPVFPSAEKN